MCVTVDQNLQKQVELSKEKDQLDKVMEETRLMEEEEKRRYVVVVLISICSRVSLAEWSLVVLSG